MIYFDNAATTFPKPLMIKKAADTFFSDFGGNPGRSGHNFSVNTAKQIFNSRSAVKDMFNAKSEENVVFTLNCTHSINTVLNGLLKKGDHIIDRKSVV